MHILEIYSTLIRAKIKKHIIKPNQRKSKLMYYLHQKDKYSSRVISWKASHILGKGLSISNGDSDSQQREAVVAHRELSDLSYCLK